MCTHIIHRQTAHKHFNQANNGGGGDFEVYRIFIEHRVFLSISSTNVVHVQCSKAFDIIHAFQYYLSSNLTTFRTSVAIAQISLGLSVSRCIAMLSRDSAGPVCSRRLNKLTMIEPLLTGWVGLGSGYYHPSARIVLNQDTNHEML